MWKLEREEKETKTNRKRGSRPVVSDKAYTYVMTHPNNESEKDKNF